MKGSAWRCVGVLAVAGALTACGFYGPQPVTYTAYQLTCCTKADIEQTWRPGTTVGLHWIVETSSRTTVNPTHLVTITSKLLGPNDDVASLKTSKPATQTVNGSVTTYDDRKPPPAESLVATFMLPPNLLPGLYRLDFNSDFGDGSSAGGSSIVRVGTP